MDRTNRRIFVIVLSALIIGSGITFMSNLFVKGNLSPFHSWTIEESKEGGYFLTEYKPLTKKLKLKYHSDSVELFRLWTERERKKEKTWIFYNTILSGDTYFQIDYRQYPSQEFIFQIEGYGGHGGQGTNQTDFKSDTVTFQIIEKSPMDTLGWREQLAGQLVKFVRTE